MWRRVPHGQLERLDPSDGLNKHLEVAHYDTDLLALTLT